MANNFFLPQPWVLLGTGLLVAATCGWEVHCNSNCVEPFPFVIPTPAISSSSERSATEHDSIWVAKKSFAILDFTGVVQS